MYWPVILFAFALTLVVGLLFGLAPAYLVRRGDFFFFKDRATPGISPLPLPAPLPISCPTAPPTSGPGATARPPMPPQIPMIVPRRAGGKALLSRVRLSGVTTAAARPWTVRAAISRSEEHTSELQSRLHLVCRLLLEKK